MPFDPIGFEEKYPFIPSPEGLRVLARALRAPMPEGFRFYFGVHHELEECGYVGCAMGLVKTLWYNEDDNIVSGNIAKIFKIPRTCASRLFVAPNVPYSKITPPMVADAIDRYLDTGEIWPEDLRPS